MELSWLDLIAGDSNGKRPLDELHRNDEALIAIHSLQDTLNAFEAPSADPDPLAHTEIWERSEPNAMFEHNSHRLNLLIGNGNTSSPDAHELNNSKRSQNQDASRGGISRLDKNITGEEGNINHATPIAPPMVFGKQRQKNLYPFLLQSRSDTLFMTGTGLDGKP